MASCVTCFSPKLFIFLAGAPDILIDGRVGLIFLEPSPIGVEILILGGAVNRLLHLLTFGIVDIKTPSRSPGQLLAQAFIFYIC
jgi:hypothetical protein